MKSRDVEVMEREWSSNFPGGKPPSLPLAHHLGDGMTDDCARLFGLLLREASCDTHLQSGEQDLLGLKVVLKSLQSSDENAIGKALRTS